MTSPANAPTVHVLAHAQAAVEALHAALVDRSNDCIERRGRFVCSLAGGSTPEALYRRLSQPGRGLDWKHTMLLFGDERPVPPDDPQSNYRMVHAALLDPAEVPPTSVRRIESELGADEAATRYEALLRSELVTPAAMDVALLGLGDDAHTASLFPGTPALDERERWVVANPVAKFDTKRITMTYPLLNGAQEAWFLVTGANKAGAVARLLEPGANRKEVPSAGIRPVGGVHLWLDAPAAAKLPR